MPYRGHIENGAVVLDEPADIPEGTAVTVEPVAAGNRAERGVSRWNWKGVYRNSGPVPSEVDIAEMRREVWPGS
jgi:hypothetical protein